MKLFAFIPLLLASLQAMGDPISDYLQSEMKTRRIPGLALLVVQAGRPVRTNCLGLANLEHQVPVRPETIFEIGSITKQFTAAGILVLVQERRLSLSDSIRRHLPQAPATWEDITVSHLLNHTSGIKTYTGLPGFELTRQLSQRRFIDLIGTHPLEFQPGTKWKYCNTGYNLLGFIIENLSGQSYWDFMFRKVFEPAEMLSTTNRLPSLIIPNRAAGYEWNKGTQINRDYDLTDVFAAGALVSNLGDLGRWAVTLGQSDLLSDASKRAMWTGYTLASGDDTGYGLGWHIGLHEGRKNIGHGGSTSGFSASFQLFPEDRLAVIVLTNTDDQVATAIARRVATLFLKTQGGRG